MIEWRVIEQRDQVAWSADGSRATASGTGRPGILNYVAAGVTLIATGVIAFFAFSFLLLVIVPVLLLGGAVMAWRWRRMLKAHQERFKQTQSQGQSHTGPSMKGRPFTRERSDDDVIDV